jgi:hypothetical protein
MTHAPHAAPCPSKRQPLQTIPKPAEIGDTANREEAVIDRILELNNAIQMTPAQRIEVLRQVALRLEQEERLHQ